MKHDSKPATEAVETAANVPPDEATGTPASPDQQETTTPEAPPEPPDIEALILEAEQRGYLRGRNESIALAMQEPAHWQSPDTPAPEDEPVPTILANMRRSIWE